MRVNEYILPKNKDLIIDLMYVCKALSYETRIEELDCSKTIVRRPTTKSFHRILSMTWYQENFTQWFFLTKKNYPNETEYLDVGLRVYENKIDYFIWMKLDIKYLDELVKNFNIIVRNLKLNNP